MTARIFRPAKTAMQSGAARKDWLLEFEPEAAKVVEPLMGWTSSSDTKSQVRLRFATCEEAVAYCERNGIVYQIFDPKDSSRRPMAYADNFSYQRRGLWTH